ncbi:hypothetical protein K525DRAFT_201616, partial [Schizophyllum commune Loenen D]
VPFGVTYEKFGTIQRRLAWPLHKDDTLFRSGRPTGLNIYALFAYGTPSLIQIILPHGRGRHTRVPCLSPLSCLPHCLNMHSGLSEERPHDVHRPHPRAFLDTEARLRCNNYQLACVKPHHQVA